MTVQRSHAQIQSDKGGVLRTEEVEAGLAIPSLKNLKTLIAQMVA